MSEELKPTAEDFWNDMIAALGEDRGPVAEKLIELLKEPAAAAVRAELSSSFFIEAARVAIRRARAVAAHAARGPIRTSERIRKERELQAQRECRARDKRIGRLPPVPGHKRCGICGDTGHNRKTCPR